MSWFSDCLAQGMDTFIDATGESVTLSRASNTTSVTAVVVTSSDDVTDGKVSATNYWDREWLVKKTDYKIDGTVVEPQSADRITDSNGDVWEMMLRGRRPDVVPHAGGYAWIVRTKRIVSG